MGDASAKLVLKWLCALRRPWPFMGLAEDWLSSRQKDIIRNSKDTKQLKERENRVSRTLHDEFDV